MDKQTYDILVNLLSAVNTLNSTVKDQDVIDLTAEILRQLREVPID